MKLVISGTTGVGKSTTVNLLKKYLENKGRKVVVIGELVAGSPYFDLYFNNLSEWGFLAQMDFLLERFRQYLETEELVKKEPNTIFVFDRHFLEDKIFNELYWVQQNVSNFNANQYKIIWNKLLAMLNEFTPIDFFILLKADFDIVQSRKKIRGRTQEEMFHIKYWKDLYWKYYNATEYRRIFKENSLHFVELLTDDKKPEEVVSAIVKYVNKRHGI